MAVTACVLFIASLTAYYYLAESGFNPYPQKTSLPSQDTCSPAKRECPGFSIANATLRSLSLTDIKSQQVTFSVTAAGPAPMARVAVYMDNVSLGAVNGPFAAATPRLVSLGVPTTMSVKVGQRYSLVIDGHFVDSSGNGYDLWQSIDVVATGG